MVVLGLLLILLGGAAILAAVFLSEGTASLLGSDLSALSIFLIGVGTGAAIIWGYTVLKWGTRRSLAQRRERRELNRLSEKLDRVEADRRTDHGDTDTRPDPGDTPPERRA
jgi:hypothetical protein